MWRWVKCGGSEAVVKGGEEVSTKRSQCTVRENKCGMGQN